MPSVRLAAANGPADRVRALRGDLDQIVRKAMAPDLNARYASVAGLADDVQRWLDDRPVSARRPSFAKQLRALVRRHRWPAAVGASLLAGTIATAGLGTWLAVGNGLALPQNGLAQLLPARAGTAWFPLDGGRGLALLPGGRLEVRDSGVAGARRSPATIPEAAEIGLGGNERSEGRGVAFTPDGRHALFQPWRRGPAGIRPAQ